MDVEALLDEVIRAGRTAGAICRKVQHGSDLSGVSKSGDEPVTVADYASQAVILRALARLVPDDAILAEEGSEHLRQQEANVRDRVHALVRDALGEAVGFDRVCEWIDAKGPDGAARRWAIDPIDGTKGFLRREQYAVAIGRIDGAEPGLGVLVCPNLPVDPARPDGAKGIVFAAARGKGARAVPMDGDASWRDGRPVRVNPTADPARVRVLGSVESAHGDPKMLLALVAEAKLGGGIVRVDSQVKYGALARGEAEVYLRPRSGDRREYVWDHAAGAIVATEAGARITDVEGKPLDFGRGRRLEANWGILCSNGPLHDALLAGLRRVHPAPPEERR